MSEQQGTGSQNYTSPNFVIPYVLSANVSPELKPIIKKISLAFQNIIQTLITNAGIAPRSAAALITSDNDPDAFLSNNVHRFYTQASETIAEGAAVNLWPQTGIIFVRNANATDGTKQADGFCSQTGGITLGSIGEVILGDGMVNNLTGLVVGDRYFLSTTDGEYTSTAPTAAGNLEQSLGIAITTTNLRFLLGKQVQH